MNEINPQSIPEVTALIDRAHIIDWHRNPDTVRLYFDDHEKDTRTVIELAILGTEARIERRLLHDYDPLKICWNTEGKVTRTTGLNRRGLSALIRAVDRAYASAGTRNRYGSRGGFTIYR
jgi:hypothetical protein